MCELKRFERVFEKSASRFRPIRSDLTRRERRRRHTFICERGPISISDAVLRALEWTSGPIRLQVRVVWEGTFDLPYNLEGNKRSARVLSDSKQQLFDNLTALYGANNLFAHLRKTTYLNVCKVTRRMYCSHAFARTRCIIVAYEVMYRGASMLYSKIF